MNRREHESIFKRVLKEHGGIVLKVARSYASSPADVDDLMQEIWLAIWKSVPDFRGEAKLSTYLYRIALNRAISWKRRVRTHSRKLEALAEEAECLPVAEDADRVSELYAAIRRLGEDERAVVLMHLDGYRYAEIGTALGISESNVGARLTRIRQKLSKELAQPERK
ncbi:MAG: RNA polymerase sigma factor [Verrucomicrobiota bacterium]